MGGGVDWNAGLRDLVDQVVNLTPVQWGFVWITVVAVFVFAWVMGGPKEQRPAIAGAAAMVAGVAVGLGLALFSPHRLA